MAETDANNLVPIGKKTPVFSLLDQSGKPHALDSYLGRWVVLYFYPKDDTPSCTRQACEFRDADAALTDTGLVVLGVSPDNEKSHAKFAEEFSLPFPLLADVGAIVCQTYGVWQEKSMFGRKYMGVVRTTYLIDPNGKVAHRWDKVKVPGHVGDVLAVATRLAAAQSGHWSTLMALVRPLHSPEAESAVSPI